MLHMLASKFVWLQTSQAWQKHLISNFAFALHALLRTPQKMVQFLLLMHYDTRFAGDDGGGTSADAFLWAHTSRTLPALPPLGQTHLCVSYLPVCRSLGQNFM